MEILLGPLFRELMTRLSVLQYIGGPKHLAVSSTGNLEMKMLTHNSIDNAPDRACTMALPRWYTNGRSGPVPIPEPAAVKSERDTPPQVETAEFVQLRIRVIALENLVITLLAEASERQLNLAREMAVYISQRPGSTSHTLTTLAAGHMVDLVTRADQFRLKPVV
jgi:hypothetical protein